MVWDVSFTCDICGRKKLESNHWWMLTLGDVPCFEEGQPRQRFTLMPWNKAESGNAGVLPPLRAGLRHAGHGTLHEPRQHSSIPAAREMLAERLPEPDFL